MKYEESSLLEFLYSCNNSFVSETEMYIYLKNITGNFDLTAFDLIRKELNLFCCNIKIIPPVIEEGVLVHSFKNETSLYEFFCEKLLQPFKEQIETLENVTKEQKETFLKHKDIELEMIKIDFVEKLGIKGKIQMIQDFVPEFDMNLFDKNSGIIKFSDIAETEYKRVTESTPNEIETTLKGINRPNNRVMETNYIIPTYLCEFISFLERVRAFVVEENTAVEPHLDSYDYFEKKQLFRETINQMFLKGLVSDILRVKKLLEVAKTKNNNFINRKHPLRAYNENGIVLNQNEVFNNIAIENIKEIDSLINHINNLIADTDKQPDTTLPTKQPNPKVNNTHVQPLNFAGLFKYPYNQNMEQFIKILKECNLIDDNSQWRTVDNNGDRTRKNDIGKFYNWLYSETTVFSKTTDKTNECICFCNNYGIIAYKEGEKPKTGRMVAIESITKAKYNSENSKYYDIHFKTWLNKEK